MGATKLILDSNNWHFNENLSFAIKSYIRKRKIGKGKQATTINEKVVITWNQKYAIREKIRRDGAIEYAQKLTNAQLYHQTSKKGGKKYLENPDPFDLDGVLPLAGGLLSAQG